MKKYLGCRSHRPCRTGPLLIGYAKYNALPGYLHLVPRETSALHALASGILALPTPLPWQHFPGSPELYRC